MQLQAQRRRKRNTRGPEGPLLRWLRDEAGIISVQGRLLAPGRLRLLHRGARRQGRAVLRDRHEPRWRARKS